MCRVKVKQASHYRAMAERRLAEAQQATDRAAKLALLEIAGRYEWLAEWSRAEQQRRGERPQPVVSESPDWQNTTFAIDSNDDK